MPVSFSSMSDPAKPRRPYDSTRRREQATHTRTRIVEAAARTFLERGYAGATIPAIAAEAGVAVETVYRSASGKSGLLAAAVQLAIAGGTERAELLSKVFAETDPRRQLAAYADTQPGVWSRVGPLLRVLDAAAGTDTMLVELQESQALQRLGGLRRFGAALGAAGALRPGLTADRAGDLIWTICAQANYDALVTVLGWSHKEYRDWLSETLVASLLTEAGTDPDPSTGTARG